MKKERNVQVIIVNHNGWDYLEDCLRSLEQQNYPKDCLDILVVDNASVDGSVEFIQSRFPEVKVIRNQENLGFATGSNIGIRKAIDEGFAYVALLNQDTIVAPGWLSELVKVAESDKRIAAVQSKILLYPERTKINTFGNAIHYLGFGFCNHYRQENGERFSYVKEVAYASAAAVLQKTEILKEIGLFDDYFFMYHEDLNMGWRYLMAGYKNVVAPKSIVYHKYTFTKGSHKYYWMERNRYIVMLENYSLPTLFLILPALVVIEIGLFFFFLKVGFWREKLKAYGYFCRPGNWAKLLAHRRAEQGKRKVTDREIMKYFSGRLEFEDIKNPLLDRIANPVLDFYFRLIRRIVP